MLEQLGPVIHRPPCPSSTARWSTASRTTVVRGDRFAVASDGWTELERSVFEEHRWWTPAELSTVAEPLSRERGVAGRDARHRSGRPVSVSRRIAAPPEAVLRVLADPARHPQLDGSGMVRGARTTAVVTESATCSPSPCTSRARRLRDGQPRRLSSTRAVASAGSRRQDGVIPATGSSGGVIGGATPCSPTVLTPASSRRSTTARARRRRLRHRSTTGDCGSTPWPPHWPASTRWSPPSGELAIATVRWQ